MKTVDIKNVKVAKKYADALFQTARACNCLDMIYNELVFVNETFESNSELKAFLINPIIKIEDKKDVLNKIFAPHCAGLTNDFLSLLAQEGRLGIISEILNRFSLSYYDANNIIKPVVISAIELDDGQKHRIEEKLAFKFKKKVYPKYEINPDIIGGLIIENGDMTIDCSLKTKFENIKKQLTKGNNYGND